MGRMKRAAVALALFFVALTAHAQNSQTWGFETWACGTAQFNVRVGDGRNILLRGISGLVTASPLPGAIDAAPGVIRQSLIAVLATTAAGARDGAIISTPSGTNHSLDTHVANVNVKQSGLTVPPPHAIAQTFDPPVSIPGGLLMAVVVTGNYGGTASCLDTEVQLTLVYQ
jgi:hypothetical protein